MCRRGHKSLWDRGKHAESSWQIAVRWPLASLVSSNVNIVEYFVPFVSLFYWFKLSGQSQNCSQPKWNTPPLTLKLMVIWFDYVCNMLLNFHKFCYGIDTSRSLLKIHVLTLGIIESISTGSYGRNCLSLANCTCFKHVVFFKTLDQSRWKSYHRIRSYIGLCWGN